MQISSDQAHGLLKIAGTLHISEAELLRQELCKCLAQETALSLDLSEVDACDAASLQLFYAARASALHQHKKFRVAVFSKAVTETGEALGMPLELLTKAESGGADDANRGNNGAQ